MSGGSNRVGPKVFQAVKNLVSGKSPKEVLKNLKEGIALGNAKPKVEPQVPRKSPLKAKEESAHHTFQIQGHKNPQPHEGATAVESDDEFFDTRSTLSEDEWRYGDFSEKDEEFQDAQGYQSWAPKLEQEEPRLGRSSLRGTAYDPVADDDEPHAKESKSFAEQLQEKKKNLKSTASPMKSGQIKGRPKNSDITPELQAKLEARRKGLSASVRDPMAQSRIAKAGVKRADPLKEEIQKARKNLKPPRETTSFRQPWHKTKGERF